MARHRHDGNGHEHVTETPDVSHIKNVDVTHETSDVSVSALLKFVGGLTVMTALIAVLMWGLFRFFQTRENLSEPKPGPMAMTKEERLPPEPRLQSAPGFGVKLQNGEWVPLENREPQAEFRILYGQWERQLNCEQNEASGGHGAATSNQHETTSHAAATGTGCMKIEDAMRKVAEQGLPSRQAGADGGSAADVALPTAASSGRVWARR